MRLKTFIRWSVVLAVLVSLCVAAIIMTFDIDGYRPELQALATEALGRAVSVDGPLDLKWSLAPTIMASNVRIANPEWAARPNFLSAKRLEAQVSLLALLQREIMIAYVELEGVDVHLEEGPTREKNWAFKLRERSGGSARGPSGRPIFLPVVERVEIRGAAISYRSAQWESAETIVVEELEGGSMSDGRLGFSATGSFRDQTYSLELTGGSLTELIRPTEPWPVDVAFTVPGHSLLARGTVAVPPARETIQLSMELSGDHLDSLNDLVGAELPHVGPYEVAGNLSLSSAELSVTDLNGTLGQTDIGGTVYLALQGSRPTAKVLLDSDAVHLEDFQDAESARTPLPVAVGLKTFEWPVEEVRALDARLELNVKQLLLRDRELGSLAVTANLEEGLLQVQVFRAGRYIGTGRARFLLDARGKVPFTILEMSSKNFDYGRTLELIGVTDHIAGVMDFSATLRGRGTTVHEILEHTSLEFRGGPSRLTLRDAQSVERLAVDVQSVTARIGERRPVKVDVAGRFRQKPLTVTFTSAPVVKLVDGPGLWPVTLTAKAVDASLRAKGTVPVRPDAQGLSLEFRVEGARLKDVDPSFPALGPFLVKGKVAGEQSHYRLTGLMAKVGNNDLSGELELALAGARPHLSGRLVSQLMNADSFAALRNRERTLPVEALRAIDLNLAWRAKWLRTGPFLLTDVELDGQLEDGLLRLAPFKVKVVDRGEPRGDIVGTLSLNARRDPPMLKVNTVAKSVDYGRMLRRLRVMNQIVGPGTLRLEVSSQGSTMQSLLEHASFNAVGEDTAITIGSPERGTGRKVILQNATLSAREGGPLAVDAKGVIQDVPFTLSSSTGSLMGLIAGEGEWPAKGLARLGTTSLQVDGHLNLPLDGENFVARIVLEGEDARDLNAVLLTSFTGGHPFKASGKLRDRPEGYQVTELKTHARGIDTSGALTLNLKTSRPRIGGNLAVERVYFAGTSKKKQKVEAQPDSRFLLRGLFGTLGSVIPESVEQGREPPVGERSEEAEDSVEEEVLPAPVEKEIEKLEGRGESEGSEKPRVFPDFPIPVDALRKLDLAVDFVVKDFESPVVKSSDLAFMVTLDDGMFTFGPFRGVFWKGDLAGRLTIDATGSIPTMAVHASVEGLDYGQVFRALDVTDIVEGQNERIEVDLTGRGTSFRQILGSADGRVEIVGGPAQIGTRLLDLWAAGLVQTAVSTAFEDKKVTETNCAVGLFRVEEGIMKSEALLVDTTRSTIAGIGTLDLNTEYLDFVLTPKIKDPSLVNLAKQVRVSGDLANPRVSAKKREIAASAGWAVLGIAVPITLVVAVPKVMGTTMGSDDENPCVTALERGDPAVVEAEAKKEKGGFWDWVKNLWARPADSTEQGETTEAAKVPETAR